MVLCYLEQNVALTQKVVAYAHEHGVVVEAEIGHVGSNERAEDLDIYTSVSEAKDFVAQTNVDSLAVSIGTAHGLYKGTPKINFDRLHELAEAVSCPLVLHGGSILEMRTYIVVPPKVLRKSMCIRILWSVLQKRFMP